MVVAALLSGGTDPAAAQGPVSLDEAVEQIGRSLAESARVGRFLRLAVPDLLDLEDRTTMLGRYLAERLTTRLAATATGYSVMERRRVSQVLSELNFGAYDLVQPQNARRFGQMLGVDAVVVGTLAALPERVDLDLRIVDVENSSILAAARATLIRTSEVSSMLVPLGRDSPAGRAAVVGAPAASAPTPPAPTPNVALPEWSSRRVRVRAVRAEATPQETRVVFVVENLTAEVIDVFFRIGEPTYNLNTHIVDGDGEQYASVGGTMLRRGGSPEGTVQLQVGVPVRFTMTFEALRGAGESVTLILPSPTPLGMPQANYNFGSNVTLGPIPVTRLQR